MSTDPISPIGAESKRPTDPKPNHLFVEVVTTAGTWPSGGPDEVPSNQKVKITLKNAADALRLRDTHDWVARVDGREINPDPSFADQSLRGAITIDYGPKEGGGGSE